MKQIAFVVFFSAALASGQAPARPAPNVVSDPAADLPAQRVGPDDLLTIAVEDCPELTRTFRVLGDGTLALPLLKERIPAANRYPEEIGVDIARALAAEQLLVRPVVSVSVAEYRSIPVSVMGAVRRPITFQASGQVTLLDALSRAEGLSQDAGAEILVSRTRGADGSERAGLVRRIPVKGLIDDADPALNIRLYGGEEIRVPTAGRVYVIGNVKRSGAFPVTDGGDTTVLKVIALSEGLLPYSNKEAFIYRRDAGKSNRSEIPVPLGLIMKRKAPDVNLEANDILYIPDSSGKKMSAETIKTLATFGITTTSGLLIWR